ncbi:MAG: hypothetical protein ACM3X5_07765 [Bacillota bacterium]
MKRILMLLLAFVAATSLAADPREDGPLAMVITYRAAPANRVALRKALEGSESPRLRRWKDEGVLQSVRLLVNRHVDSATWDAMAILTFANAECVRRWERLERDFPAGVTQKTLALVSSIEEVPGDIRREGGASSAQGVQMVIPYELSVSSEEYLSYLDGYVVPQMDGWREEGVLARYGVFLAAYPAGRPWQSMLILEYKDDAALGRRDATTAKVRARLKDNPTWKAISDAKKTVRAEKAPAIADAILAR